MSDKRQIIAHAAAGLAICFGGYAFLVSPAAKDLSEVRAECVRLTNEAQRAQTLEGRTDEMTGELDRLTAEAAEIEDAGNLARNERDLFAAISNLAQRSHIRIDQLAPSKSAPKSGSAKNATDARPGDTAVRYAMTAVGGYSDAAAFLRALRSELGFVAVRSVRISPLPDDAASAVKITIETEHFAFDTTPPTEPDATGASK